MSSKTLRFGPGTVTIGPYEYFCHGMEITVDGDDTADTCKAYAPRGKIDIAIPLAPLDKCSVPATYTASPDHGPKEKRRAKWKQAAYGPGRGRR